jgi:endoglucanase
VDTGNGNVSHSEGQGYGLLFAEQADDRESYDRILAWTRDVLQIRPNDKLHAWRFQPHTRVAVSDTNNATDGDLLIALGLVRGGRRWNRPELIEQAGAIYADILHRATGEIADRSVLLPAAAGFVKPDEIVVNLSYLVFPSLIAASTLASDTTEHARWQRLIQDGLALLEQARFGHWRLPPDWMHLSKLSPPQPAKGWPPRFSFDAIRIPLYLYWAALADPAGRDRFAEYWNSFGEDALPAWVDLETGEQAPYRASAGMHAIAACTGLALPPDRESAGSSSVASDPDYYSSALMLLTRVARFERSRG